MSNELKIIEAEWEKKVEKFLRDNPREISEYAWEKHSEEFKVYADRWDAANARLNNSNNSDV